MLESKQNILIVDDDDKLRILLERFFKEQGFNVSSAPNAQVMDKRLEREHVDLIILDRMLPDEDGLSICRRLRNSLHPPLILMLTAQSSENERIHGLETGADDYLAKPFNSRELLARVKAILRRAPSQVAGAPTPELEIMHFDNITVNFLKRTLQRDAEVTELTTGEFALLKTLLLSPYQTLSREQLMKLAKDRDFSPYDRSIDTQISRLRKLIEKNPADPKYIQTVWGKGYIFVPSEQGEPH